MTFVRRTGSTLLAVTLCSVGLSAAGFGVVSASAASEPTVTVGTAAPTTPTPTPTPTPTNATTGPASPAETVNPTAAPSAVDDGSTISADPTLQDMNAAGNHTMGSTVPKETRVGGSRARSLAAVVPPGTPGFDVSGWQPNSGIDWAGQRNAGARFVYIKATESTTYRSSQFSAQYNDSFTAGYQRGAYHFAVPNKSSGAAQANYFVSNGGGWSADGRTLPPLLDIEYNPYSGTDGTNSCFGLSTSAMVNWINDFSSTVKARTGVYPAIYSTTDWWKTCTGNNAGMGAQPLFIARYPASLSSGAGVLPASWSRYTLWQYSSTGPWPGDSDVFNGSESDLATFARTGGTVPAPDPTPVTPKPQVLPPLQAGAVPTRTIPATLTSGAQLASPNKQFTLNMQADGNLVTYGNGRALWSTGTSGNSGAELRAQADGNLVLYTSTGRAIWSTNSMGSGATTLAIQNDGNVQLLKGSEVLWQSGAHGTDTAVPVTTFLGEHALTSPDGTKTVTMQQDGNFVLYSSGRATWSTGTSQNNAGAYMTLQEDGNLVLYRADEKAIWSTNSMNKGTSRLVVQNDGNLVLYAGSKAIWASDTSGR